MRSNVEESTQTAQPENTDKEDSGKEKVKPDTVSSRAERSFAQRKSKLANKNLIKPSVKQTEKNNCSVCE